MVDYYNEVVPMMIRQILHHNHTAHYKSWVVRRASASDTLEYCNFPLLPNLEPSLTQKMRHATQRKTGT